LNRSDSSLIDGFFDIDKTFHLEPVYIEAIPKLLDNTSRIQKLESIRGGFKLGTASRNVSMHGIYELGKGVDSSGSL
jgi:hypothetical protein